MAKRGRKPKNHALENKDDATKTGSPTQTPAAASVTPTVASLPTPPQPPPLQNRYVILSYYPGTSIDIADVISLRDELHKNIKNPKQTRINLILHSWGGDVYSAFKMIKTIRSFCTELYALVPLRAVSAASLMTLAADRIYMSPQSQLGPLDLPTEHPTIQGTSVSSIDCVQALPYIEGVFKSSALNRYAEIQRWTSLGKKDAITLAYNVAAKLVEPLTSKIDPIQTSKSSRDLEIAKKYGTELLQRYGKVSPSTRSKAEDIVDKLVYEYPSHGFAICYDEAEKIGLNVFRSTTHPEWDKVWKMINRIQKLKKKVIWHFTQSQLNAWSK